MDITVFLGAPGSGKGTQAKRLAQSGRFAHFSTGDMLRLAIQRRIDVGIKAKAFIDRGELVPDNIMIELIERALAEVRGDTRVILDGFPRTLPQAEALDEKPSTTVGRVVYFEVPEPKLVLRLTGRRICEKCGEPFHVEFQPPRKAGVCDKCGGNLIQRTDDSEEVVRHRLSVYRNQTLPLLSYYQSRNRLERVDGDQDIEVLMANLLKILR